MKLKILAALALAGLMLLLSSCGTSRWDTGVSAPVFTSTESIARI